MCQPFHKPGPAGRTALPVCARLRVRQALPFQLGRARLPLCGGRPSGFAASRGPVREASARVSVPAGGWPHPLDRLWALWVEGPCVLPAPALTVVPLAEGRGGPQGVGVWTLTFPGQVWVSQVAFMGPSFLGLVQEQVVQGRRSVCGACCRVPLGFAQPSEGAKGAHRPRGDSTSRGQRAQDCMCAQ